MQDNIWEQFLASRDDMLRQLGEPVLEGIARLDRPHHPVFHGNYDWHSCVHACYALTVLHRLTADSKYIDVVNDLLDPKKLNGEVLLLDENRVTPDIKEGRQFAWFYGFSWLLQLATEYEQTTGDKRLRPLAQKAAEKLAQHIFNLSPEQITSFATDPEYRNLSWKILCLHRWLQFIQDQGLVQKLIDFTKQDFMNASFEAQSEGFFSPSLMRADVLLKVVSGAQGMFGNIVMPTPVIDLPGPASGENPSRGHVAGLNFSRAWGLWPLYKSLGDKGARDLYAGHIMAQFNQKSHWHSAPDGVFDKKIYDYYGHWVPQFGIRAIAASIETPSLSCT